LTKVKGTIYYIAPEVFLRDYGAKCDVWSIGVMTYLFLSGKQPFANKNAKDNEVQEAILAGRYSFDDPSWESISNDAKDFI
jgi:serine/threonine protein kinase